MVNVSSAAIFSGIYFINGRKVVLGRFEWYYVFEASAQYQAICQRFFILVKNIGTSFRQLVQTYIRLLFRNSLIKVSSVCCSLHYKKGSLLSVLTFKDIEVICAKCIHFQGKQPRNFHFSLLHLVVVVGGGGGGGGGGKGVYP